VRSVAETIRGSLGRFTPMERRPDVSLLAHYPVTGRETRAQFARWGSAKSRMGRLEAVRTHLSQEPG
jgi:hypothetical protein